jgi:hypothetical protein
VSEIEVSKHELVDDLGGRTFLIGLRFDPPGEVIHCDDDVGLSAGGRGQGSEDVDGYLLKRSVYSRYEGDGNTPTILVATGPSGLTSLARASMLFGVAIHVWPPYPLLESRVQLIEFEMASKLVTSVQEVRPHEQSANAVRYDQLHHFLEGPGVDPSTIKIYYSVFIGDREDLVGL